MRSNHKNFTPINFLYLIPPLIFLGFVVFLSTPVFAKDDDGDSFEFPPDGLDCNDNDASVYPGAEEILDGKDNDCNGMVDEVFVNEPPVISPSLQDIELEPGSSFTLDFNVHDPEGDLVTVSVKGLPAGVDTQDREGLVETIAGSGVSGYADGNSVNAQFNRPQGIDIDSDGNIYVADTLNQKIRIINIKGYVSTFAGNQITKTDSGTTNTSQLNMPNDLVIANSGNFYVTNYYGHNISKIDKFGTVSHFAGIGTIGSTDGPLSSASFTFPSSIDVDVSGNIVISELGNTIRKIDKNGFVRTLAGTGEIGDKIGVAGLAQFHSPGGISIDNVGNIYLTDTDNRKLKKITPGNQVELLAGNGGIGNVNGPALTAQIRHPRAIAVDEFGNVYFTEWGFQSIRKIDKYGMVSTFAGGNGSGDVVGPASLAKFNNPDGIVVDKLGNVYVADTYNHKIKKITPPGYQITGTYSGDPVGGTFPVTIRATDSEGAYSEASFNIIVPGIVSLVDASSPLIEVGDDTGGVTAPKVANLGKGSAAIIYDSGSGITLNIVSRKGGLGGSQNLATPGYCCEHVDISGLKDSFVTSWTDPVTKTIKVQRFDASGQPLPWFNGDATIQVKIPGNSNDNLSPATSAFGTRDSNRSIVVWQAGFGSTKAIWGQRIHENGRAYGDAFAISDENGVFTSPDVTRLSNGKVVVVWESGAVVGTSQPAHIYARIIAAPKATSEPIIEVTSGSGTERDASVFTLGSGFAVVWREGNSSTGPLFAQRFDKAGALVGSKFQVTPLGADAYGHTRGDAAGAALADGGFFIVWSGIDGAIYGRRFDSSASPMGDPVSISNANGLVNQWPDVERVGPNGVLVTWKDPLETIQARHVIFPDSK